MRRLWGRLICLFKGHEFWPEKPWIPVLGGFQIRQRCRRCNKAPKAGG